MRRGMKRHAHDTPTSKDRGSNGCSDWVLEEGGTREPKGKDLLAKTKRSKLSYWKQNKCALLHYPALQYSPENMPIMPLYPMTWTGKFCQMLKCCLRADMMEPQPETKTGTGIT
eukprot:1148650-Pelagomonas_calceolata.AAC.4